MKESAKKRMKAVHRGELPETFIETGAGAILADWKSMPLSEITEALSEQAGNRAFETMSISAGIGFVNQAEKFGKELSGKQYAKYIVLHRGDFSYNKGNSNRFPQGCIYRLEEREEAAVPNVFESFRIIEGNDDFFNQLFLSGFLNRQLCSKINHGVRDDGLLNLTSKDFYSCEVPFPPIQEQEKIAEILSQCDNLIDLQQEKIVELKKFKKFCLQKMFPKDGCDVPEIRFPGFTETWEQRKVGDLALDTFGGGTPSTSNEAYWNGDIPWIQSSDLTEHQVYGVIPHKHISRAGLMNSATKLVPADSLAVITRVGVGKLAVMPFSYTTSQDFLPLSKLQTDKWFTAYALYRKLRGELNSVQGTSIKGITKEDLLAKKIFIPNCQEQETIGAFFSNLDHLIALHQRELEEFQRKKKALAHLLLSGIVRVSI